MIEDRLKGLCMLSVDRKLVNNLFEKLYWGAVILRIII